MVVGLHATYMKQNDETSCNCFKSGGEMVAERRWWGQLINVQCEVIKNWHNESPLYNECM
jgi:hypothetical protein